MTVGKDLPAPKDFKQCKPIRVHLPAIAAGERWTPPAHFGPPEMELAKRIGTISERTETLIVFGRIRYEDVLKNSYESGFCWIYYPPHYVDFHDQPNLMMLGVSPILFPGQFSLGPETHNYRE
jgi:hypothetical protein